MASQKITVRQSIQDTPEAVWFALSRIPVVTQWMCDSATIQANEGGRFYAWWNEGWYASGIFTEVKENERMAYTWQGKDEPGESKVTVDLSKANGSTEVTLVHETPDGAEWKSHLEGFEANWAHLLENLKFTVERGLDKRLFDRPFLGIMLNGIPDEDIAKRLSLPEHGKWIHIAGTVAGTGAEAAGLKADDVMVSLGGHKTDTFQDLNVALSARKAGDTVEVELYRDSKKETHAMKLSHRPQPEMPHTIKEAAAEVRKVNAEISKELAALFEGVSEADASARPEEKEWSAKEVLAHLLMNEHWYHMYVSTAVNGQRIPGYTNDLGTVGAIASSYDTVADILAAFTRAMETSIRAAESLPEAALNRKYDYSGLIQAALNGNPQHTRGHYPQIEHAIAAAREKA
jgi:uncharacterized protein YndB with AHSA1/START domain